MIELELFENFKFVPVRNIYIWQTGIKLTFSNGYNWVIFKVKMYEKIIKHIELTGEFKNAKAFQKKILSSLKIGNFKKYLFSIIKNRWFSKNFTKIPPNFFCMFELARQFSMFINFDFKNDLSYSRLKIPTLDQFKA